MRKTFFFIFSMGIAFVADLLFGGTTIFNVIPLFGVCTACVWFWHLGFASRISSAFVIGSVMDAIHFSPVGTYLLVLVMLACVTEWMKSFFSNTESVVVKGMSIVILLILFRVCVSPISSFLASTRMQF
ncbi:MAG: rod shape-determining protein MreD [Candidatus Sungbacteria bacterium]|nr:rod shape-determining protein MreD [bacterium]MDZ4260299.1 rod shape-determining protein MreD [Candidatus Sungbacteria bacterium]